PGRLECHAICFSWESRLGHAERKSRLGEILMHMPDIAFVQVLAPRMIVRGLAQQIIRRRRARGELLEVSETVASTCSQGISRRVFDAAGRRLQFSFLSNENR
ncbi:MAG: hypothetical protein OXI01_05485, partial [Albidovulum sp.]|nr:hypothetical protein [Albidovulum sp.]